MQHPRVNRLEKQGIDVAGGRKGKEKRGQGEEEDIKYSERSDLRRLAKRSLSYVPTYFVDRIQDSTSFRW